MVVVVNSNREFRALGPEDFRRRATPVVVFDCWRILREKLADSTQVAYVPMGVGQDEDGSAERLAAIWSGRPA